MKWAPEAHRTSWRAISCGPRAEVTHAPFFHKLPRLTYFMLISFLWELITSQECNQDWLSGGGDRVR